MKLNILYFRAGTTRSGKFISCASKEEDVDSIMHFFQTSVFSDDDLLDVFALFEYLALRAKRRNSSHLIFRDHSERVLRYLPAENFLAAKLRAKITSAFELRDLGQSRANKEFADL
jgi:hypothetical protein